MYDSSDKSHESAGVSPHNHCIAAWSGAGNSVEKPTEGDSDFTLAVARSQVDAIIDRLEPAAIRRETYTATSAEIDTFLFRFREHVDPRWSNAILGSECMIFSAQPPGPSREDLLCYLRLRSLTISTFENETPSATFDCLKNARELPDWCDLLEGIRESALTWKEAMSTHVKNEEWKKVQRERDIEELRQSSGDRN